MIQAHGRMDGISYRIAVTLALAALVAITPSYPNRVNSQHAKVNSTTRRAGSSRYRRSRTSAASITSSISSFVNVRARTPIEIRSGSRSDAALASRVTPATHET